MNWLRNCFHRGFCSYAVSVLPETVACLNVPFASSVFSGEKGQHQVGADMNPRTSFHLDPLSLPLTKRNSETVLKVSVSATYERILGSRR